MWLVICVGVALVIAIYYYLTWNYEYWKTRGVLSPKPKLLFGNLGGSFKREIHTADEITSIYQQDFALKKIS